MSEKERESGGLQFKAILFAIGFCNKKLAKLVQEVEFPNRKKKKTKERCEIRLMKMEKVCNYRVGRTAMYNQWS